VTTEKKPGIRIPKWVDKLLFAIGVGLVIYIVSRYPLGQTWDAIAGMFPAVLITPLIAVSWFGSSASALYLLLDRKVSWWRILWIRLVGDSYNALLPAAGFGGEPFKIRQLSQNVEPALVMATLIRDRIIDNAVGFLVSGGGIALGLLRYSVDPKVEVGLFIYGVVCAALGVAGTALMLTRLPGKLGTWLAKVLGDVAPEKIDTLPLGRVLQVGAWYVVSRALGLTEKLALLWILHLPHDVLTVFFIDGAVSAAGYIGFMIPQGLGVFEGATIYVFGVIGAPGPAAVAFAFARRARMITVGLFGISLHLVVVAKNWLARRR
jgi:uncharacterized membrane protein YbhN (UPF0104 family)